MASEKTATRKMGNGKFARKKRREKTATQTQQQQQRLFNGL